MMVTDPDCLATDYDPIQLEDIRNFEPILEHIVLICPAYPSY